MNGTAAEISSSGTPASSQARTRSSGVTGHSGRRPLISTDTKAPAIKIVTPVDGGTVAKGATVLADFSCDDGGGVGVQSCVGTVAKGAKVDTATVGTKSFTVTATDKEGKVGTKTVTYKVV